ncbi:hypothetical protein AALB53_00980 [Lachnospiraceae bacterium 47-T17]
MDIPRSVQEKPGTYAARGADKSAGHMLRGVRTSLPGICRAGQGESLPEGRKCFG